MTKIVHATIAQLKHLDLSSVSMIIHYPLHKSSDPIPAADMPGIDVIEINNSKNLSDIFISIFERITSGESDVIFADDGGWMSRKGLFLAQAFSVFCGIEIREARAIIQGYSIVSPIALSIETQHYIEYLRRLKTKGKIQLPDNLVPFKARIIRDQGLDLHDPWKDSEYSLYVNPGKYEKELDWIFGVSFGSIREAVRYAAICNLKLVN